MKYFKNLVMALLVLCFSVIGYSTSYAYNGDAEHITVSGAAEQEVAPDIAYVYISIYGRGESADNAASSAAAKTAAVKKALLGLNITSDKFESVNYYLSPVYNKNKVTGYQANNNLKISVNDLSKVGSVIDKAAAAGVDAVNNIEFSVSNKELLQRQLLSAAVENARQHAAVVANAGNRNLGRMIAVNVNNSYNNVGRMYNSVMLKSEAAADTATVIKAKNIKVSASVEVTYALQ